MERIDQEVLFLTRRIIALETAAKKKDSKPHPLEASIVRNGKRLSVLESARKVQIRLNAGFVKKTAKVEKEIKKIWKWW